MSQGHETTSPRLAGMKYFLESILRTDSDGTVMLIGDQNAMGKHYALGIIKREGPDDDIKIEVARARVEASTKANHPNVLKYYDLRIKRKFFRIDRAEVLMEYVSGKSLDQLEDLTLDQLILVFSKIAAALAHLHRREVRHGNLDPVHVTISRTGGVKLGGYGLSMLPPQYLQSMPGNRAYQAPEQIRGKLLTQQSDIYALGALMYHLATGRPANVGGRAKGEVEKIPLPTRLNPGITAELNDLLVTCLQHHPPKRPESMYAVSQTLEEILKSKGIDESDLQGVAGPSAQ